VEGGWEGVEGVQGVEGVEAGVHGVEGGWVMVRKLRMRLPMDADVVP
jgi:hypothetical protein